MWKINFLVSIEIKIYQILRSKTLTISEAVIAMVMSRISIYSCLQFGVLSGPEVAFANISTINLKSSSNAASERTCVVNMAEPLSFPAQREKLVDLFRRILYRMDKCCNTMLNKHNKKQIRKNVGIATADRRAAEIFWGPRGKLMNEAPCEQSEQKIFSITPLDWLKNAFQSNSCSQIVKIFNWGSLDPAAQGQTAPPAPPLSEALMAGWAYNNVSNLAWTQMHAAKSC